MAVFPAESHTEVPVLLPLLSHPLCWLCGLHTRTKVGKEEDLILWVYIDEECIEAAPQQWEKCTRAGMWAALLDMELLLWVWFGKTRFLAGEISDVHLHAHNFVVTGLHHSLLLWLKTWFTEFQPCSQLPEQHEAGRNTDLQHQRWHTQLAPEVINWHHVIWWE